MGEQTTFDDTVNKTSSTDDSPRENKQSESVESSSQSSKSAKSSSSQSSGHRYTKIYKSDIWGFIVDSPWYFVEVDLDNSNEYVFEIRYTGEDSPVDDPVAIRWYTSVKKDTGVSRPVGTDAMRLVLLNLRVHKPILRSKKAQRIETWEENVADKIHAFEEQLSSLPTCPECGSVLVIVTRHTGKKFRGCSQYYPDQECTYSESL